jgi:hypothetical protein
MAKASGMPGKQGGGNAKYTNGANFNSKGGVIGTSNG